jgi:hypothetical protein
MVPKQPRLTQRIPLGERDSWVAAEGIRTLDLLHGKQDAGLGAARNIAANTPLLPRERVPPMPGIHREITGVSGLKPDWR